MSAQEEEAENRQYHIRENKNDKSLHSSGWQPVHKHVDMNGRDYKFQVDTCSPDNLCNQIEWKELGR